MYGCNRWRLLCAALSNWGGSIVDTSIPDAAGNYQFISKASSSGVSRSNTFPTEEIRVLRTTFSSLPVIWKSELSQDYKELGTALAEMTELGEEDELKIDTAVYEAACHIASALMANSYPAPGIFTHGPKSVVFDWSTGPNNLYLTISADKLSALISTPERIKRRMEYSLQELLNPSLIFPAIQSAHLEHPIRLINKATSDLSEDSSEEAVG